MEVQVRVQLRAELPPRKGKLGTALSLLAFGMCVSEVVSPFCRSR